MAAISIKTGAAQGSLQMEMELEMWTYLHPTNTSNPNRIFLVKCLLHIGDIVLTVVQPDECRAVALLSPLT